MTPLRQAISQIWRRGGLVRPHPCSLAPAWNLARFIPSEQKSLPFPPPGDDSLRKTIAGLVLVLACFVSAQGQPAKQDFNLQQSPAKPEPDRDLLRGVGGTACGSYINPPIFPLRGIPAFRAQDRENPIHWAVLVSY